MTTGVPNRKGWFMESKTVSVMCETVLEIDTQPIVMEKLHTFNRPL
jgi:hypothetical protein